MTIEEVEYETEAEAEKRCGFPSILWPQVEGLDEEPEYDDDAAEPAEDAASISDHEISDIADPAQPDVGTADDNGVEHDEVEPLTVETADAYGYDLSDPEDLAEFISESEIRIECPTPSCYGRLGGSWHERKGKLLYDTVRVDQLHHYRKVIVWCTNCDAELGAQVRKDLHLPNDAALYVRPVFDIIGPSIHIARDALATVPRAEAPDPRTFSFSESFVRVSDDGKIKPITKGAMRVTLTETARFRMANGHFTNAPFDTAAAALDLAAEIDATIPVLETVVRVPVLMADGRIHTTPGYDAESKTFYAPTVPNIQIPDVVTRQDVDAALSLIRDHLLVDFPFVSDADRANAIGLLIVGFVRGIIDGPTPLHWIGAPASRTSKGKLAACTLSPAFGDVSSSTLPEQESERRKKIDTELSRGSGAIKWDNVRGTVRSMSLEVLLTERRWNDRRLGVNFGDGAAIDVLITIVSVLTANNAVPGGDMLGRTLPINLDRKVEDPGSYVPVGGWHLPEPPEVWALAHRAELISAALVLCRWWVQEGRPAPSKVPVLGGYEEWQRVIGGILQAAGVKGFCDNLGTLAAGDDDKAEVRQVFQKLFAAYGDTAVTAAKILEDKTLVDVWDSTTAGGVGMRLQSLKNKRADGYVLTISPTRAANQWRVSKTGAA